MKYAAQPVTTVSADVSIAPRKGSHEPIVKMAKELHQNPEISIQEVCQTLKISRSTFYRYLALAETPGDPTRKAFCLKKRVSRGPIIRLPGHWA